MNEEELMALTLQRPWAHAILYGGKRTENRPWRPWKKVIGEFIALHSGASYDKAGASWMLSQGLYDPPAAHDCLAGCIVGLAKVTGYKEHTGTLSEVFNENDPWFTGPYGWELDEIVPFEKPVMCAGSPGLWSVEDETLDRVVAEYVSALRRG